MLVVKSRDGPWLLAGVTSGGLQKDCLVGDHSFDVNVFHYVDWLRQSGVSTTRETQCGSGQVINERAILGQTERLSSSKPSVSYRLDVSEVTEQLHIAMNGDDNGQGQNDFDLYLIFGDEPLIEHAVCKEDGSGQFAFCEVQNPQPGPWTILVKRKFGEGTVQIVVTTITEQ